MIDQLIYPLTIEPILEGARLLLANRACQLLIALALFAVVVAGVRRLSKERSRLDTRTDAQKGRQS